MTDKTDLASRMEAAGMTSIDKMVEQHPMEIFLIHLGVTDIDGFLWWLDMRGGELGRLAERLGSKSDRDKEDDDLLVHVKVSLAVIKETKEKFDEFGGDTTQLHQWIKAGLRENIEEQALFELDKKTDDPRYEEVSSRAGAYGEVQSNLKAALGMANPPNLRSVKN